MVIKEKKYFDNLRSCLISFHSLRGILIFCTIRFLKVSFCPHFFVFYGFLASWLEIYMVDWRTLYSNKCSFRSMEVYFPPFLGNYVRPKLTDWLTNWPTNRHFFLFQDEPKSEILTGGKEKIKVSQILNL